MFYNPNSIITIILAIVLYFIGIKLSKIFRTGKYFKITGVILFLLCIPELFLLGGVLV